MPEPDSIEVLGKAGFSFSFEIPVSEMRDWHPERIMAFFRGIAQIIAARGGNQ